MTEELKRKFDREIKISYNLDFIKQCCKIASMYISGNYEVNDLVKVLSGPFEGLTGNITAIDTQLGEVSINTVFFGRPTDISVKFSDVEKI